MEAIGTLGAIISLIALVTFFAMAWRLGNISKYVLQIGNRISDAPFYEAQTADILGKKQEAIEKYTAVLYLVTVTTYHVTKYNKKQSTEFLEERIKKLGGTIPDLLLEKNKFLSK